MYKGDCYLSCECINNNPETDLKIMIKKTLYNLKRSKFFLLPSLISFIFLGLIGQSSVFALTGEEVWDKFRCNSCHGADGNKTVGTTVPRIGGQNPKFTYNVFKVYKKGKDRSHFMMVKIAQRMSKEEIKSVSKYVGTLKTFVVDPTKNNASSEGEKLFKKYKCASCHGKNGIKAKGNTPHLAGQRYKFLVKTIREYRAKVKRYHRGMTPRAKKIKSEEDIEKIALFLSNNRP